MFFFSSRRRHTSWPRDWSSDVCSSDLGGVLCDECAPPQTPYVTDDDVALLVALHEGDWPAVNQAQPAQMRQATGFIAEYLQYHLEQHLQSLSVMDQG